MIESVVASTYQNWEMLIVDDASSEDLKTLIEGFGDARIQYFRFDENKGIPHGLNFLFPMAKGKYLCILAHDERITDKKLEEQVDYLENYPNVDAVWGLPANGDAAPKEGWPLGSRPEFEQYQLKAHNRSRYAWLRTLINREAVPIGGCTMMIKTSVVHELEGFDPALKIFTDHEFYCRFFKKHTGVILPYRWAWDLPAGADSVRIAHIQQSQQELEMVLARHKLQPPPTDGKITVFIPCYNHAHFLADSVGSVLAQTRPVDEIIILNDGSTDNFNEAVKEFSDPRIKLMAFEENMGIWEAANQMAFRAQGDFCVFLAADDYLKPDYVEKCMRAFTANPWLEFVASQTEFVTLDKKPFTENNPMARILPAQNRPQHEWMLALHGGNHYFGAGMYRTYAISEVGGWEKKYKVIADYQMYLKLLQRENIFIVEEPLTVTRVHKDMHSLLDGKRAAELPWLYHEARKAFYPRLMKVMIATPFYELKAFSPYVAALMHTIKILNALGIQWEFREISGDSYVHRARNTLVDHFLRDPDFTDLFFLDSDMAWNPDAFVKMLLLPDDVVGGAYPVKNKWDAWTSIPALHHEKGEVTLMGRELGDGTALVEAVVIAGGFMRVKRHVFERFKEKYPESWYIERTTDPNDPEHKYWQFFGAEAIDHVFYGEDHMFCRKLRDMGTRMFIFPDIDITHWGYKDFNGNFHQFLKNEKFNSAKVVDGNPDQKTYDTQNFQKQQAGARR